MKKFSSYGNNKIKDIMIDLIVWGKPNNKKLGFGDCPLNVYSDFYFRGKETYSNFTLKIEDKAFLSTFYKGKNPKREFQKDYLEKLTEVVLNMTEISCKLSQYSILDFGLDFNYKAEKIDIKSNSKPNKRFAPTNITEKVLAKENTKKNSCSYKKLNNIEKNNINSNYLKNNIKSKKQNKEQKKDFSNSEDSDNFNIKIENEKEEVDEKTEGYECDICRQIFSNGQGLGGHMSRKHPNQSEKYKFKKETREKRNSKREMLYKAQRTLLTRYRQDYDKLKLQPEGRRLIKKICKDHEQEYYFIKKEVKSTRNSNLRKKAKK